MRNLMHCDATPTAGLRLEKMAASRQSRAARLLEFRL